MNIVAIDDAWLSGKTAPYALSVEDTTYVLTKNIDVSDTGLVGEIFNLDGKNIHLDPSGYHITLNGNDHPQTYETRFYAIYEHPRRTESPLARARNDRDVKLFGGTWFDGSKTQPVIADGSEGDPPILPYMDTK